MAGPDRRPLPPVTSSPPTDRHRLGRLRLAGAAVLIWERTVLAFWPTATLLGLWAGLAWLELPQSLPGWAHMLVLTTAAVAAIWTIRRGLHRLGLPDRRAVLHRLETDSDLPHRPLSSLDDTLPGRAGDPVSLALWSAHQRRVASVLRRLRWPRPRPMTAAADRYALRGLAVLVLVIGGIAAGADWDERLGDSVTPRFVAVGAGQPMVIDLYVTPPAYTGLPPQYRRAGDGVGPGAVLEAIRVPEGSTVLARLSGVRGAAPTLDVGGTRTTFTTIDPGQWEVETALASGVGLAVRQGREELAFWTLQVLADDPPVATVPGVPEATERWSLGLPYRATDDFGVTDIAAEIALTEDAPEALAGRPAERIPLSLRGEPGREVEGLAFTDLTAHPWAGLAVSLSVIAQDGAGQTGRSDPVEITLPEREFVHPIAAALVAQRRILLHTPEQYATVAEVLEDLSVRPDRFAGDPVVFLALRTAFRRLALDAGGPASLAAVSGLLWDTALRIEDGHLSLAERQLRMAQNDLRQALETGDQRAIDDAMTALEQAMRDFLEAMQQEMADQLADAVRSGRLEDMPVTPPDGPTMRLEAFNQLVEDMLRQIEERAAAGDMEAAMEMLAQLQQMMENLEFRMALQDPQQQGPNTADQAMQTLQQLQDLMGAQQDLLDRSFQQSRPGTEQEGGAPPTGQAPPGQAGNPQSGQGGRGQTGRETIPGGDLGPLSQRQHALRRALGDVMTQVDALTGSIPGPLGQAEQAMRQAEQALDRNDAGAAIDPQTQALDALQQGLQSFVDSVMEQLAQQPQTGPDMRGGQPFDSRGRDPLNRPTAEGGGGIDQTVDVPDRMDVQRAREIVDELRRRAGERSRPESELEYIDRLLQRF